MRRHSGAQTHDWGTTDPPTCFVFSAAVDSRGCFSVSRFFIRTSGTPLGTVVRVNRITDTVCGDVSTRSHGRQPLCAQSQRLIGRLQIISDYKPSQRKLVHLISHRAGSRRRRDTASLVPHGRNWKSRAAKTPYNQTDRLMSDRPTASFSDGVGMFHSGAKHC